jgi:hypothetical protein
MTMQGQVEGKKPRPLTQDEAVKFVKHVVTTITGEAPGIVDSIKLNKLIEAAYQKEGATIVLWR